MDEHTLAAFLDELEVLEKLALYSEENSSFTHDGVEYDINRAFHTARSKESETFKMSDLVWVLRHTTPDMSRVKRVDRLDPRFPILISKDRRGRLTVVDGLHRLVRAKQRGEKTIEGKFIPKNELHRVQK